VRGLLSGNCGKGPQGIRGPPSRANLKTILLIHQLWFDELANVYRQHYIGKPDAVIFCRFMKTAPQKAKTRKKPTTDERLSALHSRLERAATRSKLPENKLMLKKTAGQLKGLIGADREDGVKKVALTASGSILRVTRLMEKHGNAQLGAG
jgi:hypothetical protein